MTPAVEKAKQSPYTYLSFTPHRRPRVRRCYGRLVRVVFTRRLLTYCIKLRLVKRVLIIS